MEILNLLVMGILGIVFYSLFKARKYMLLKNGFDPMFFYNDNKKAWIWSALVIIAVIITLSIEPKASAVLKTFTGVDLANTPSGYMSLGLALSALVSNTKKSNPKPNKEGKPNVKGN